MGFGLSSITNIAAASGVPVVSTIAQGAIAEDAQGDAARARLRASDRGIDQQNEILSQLLQLTSPTRTLGNQAQSQFASLLGLPGIQPTSQPVSQPTQVTSSNRLNQLRGGATSFRPEGRFSFESPKRTIQPTQPTQGASFQESPNFQFVLQNALNAVENSAAASGNLFSGGTLKELQDRAGGIASGEFQNQLNNLARLIQFGQTGNAIAANAITGTGNNLTDLLISQGETRAQRDLGQAQAIIDAGTASGNTLQFLLAGAGGFGG